jgi:hypothetical protein
MVEVPVTFCALACSGADICTSVGKLTDVSSIHIHDEELIQASGTWPERHKEDFPTMSRPSGGSAAPPIRWICRVLRREIDLIVPFRGHSKNGAVSFTETHESDVPSVWGPDRHLSETRCNFLCKLYWSARSVGIDLIDVNASPKDNLPSIW